MHYHFIDVNQISLKENDFVKDRKTISIDGYNGCADILIASVSDLCTLLTCLY